MTPMGYNNSTSEQDLTDPAFGIHVVALRPTSLGTVRLRSNDPFDNPVIDPRFVFHGVAKGGGDFRPRQVPDHTTRCSSAG